MSSKSKLKVKGIDNPLLVLVSGGRSSAMMARIIQTSPKYDVYSKLFVFCNTGQERPETIEFLKEMMFYWDIPLNVIEGVYSTKKGIGVKSKEVDLESMDMTGKPYAGAILEMNKIKWTGVPNESIPYCSDYLKTRPSHDFARKIFGTTKYTKALGFRAEDMPKRITFAELNEDPSRIAPLITDFESPITQSDLNEFFKKEPFKLGIHSALGNCELCWKKSDTTLIRAIKKGTRFIEWHRKQEQQYGNTFFRGKRSINDIVKLAESGTQTELFEQNQYQEEYQCVCHF